MLFSEENKIIYNLYESPDNVKIGNKYYQYDDISLGNYTGIIDNDGNYVLSDDVQGHKILRKLIATSTDPMKSVLTNVDKAGYLNRLLANGKEIRIWPKLEVFSMWQLYDILPYKDAITSAIERIGGIPEIYQYDEYGMYNLQSYDEIFGKESTDESRNKQSEANAQIDRGRNALGNYMVRSKDVDDNTPSFYKQKKKVY